MARSVSPSLFHVDRTEQEATEGIKLTVQMGPLVHFFVLAFHPHPITQNASFLLALSPLQAGSLGAFNNKQSRQLEFYFLLWSQIFSISHSQSEDTMLKNLDKTVNTNQALILYVLVTKLIVENE